MVIDNLVESVSWEKRKKEAIEKRGKILLPDNLLIILVDW